MWDKKGENLTYKFLKLLNEKNNKDTFNVIEEQVSAAGGLQTAMGDEDSSFGRSMVDPEQLKRTMPQGKPLAIVAGDSQTYYSGGALAKSLRSKGFDVLHKPRITYKSGESTDKTIKRINALKVNRPVNLVVVFTGGNNTQMLDQTEALVSQLIDNIRQKFGEDVEIVIGAAPPGRTGSPAAVKRIFRKEAHTPEYKEKRKMAANLTAQAAAAKGVEVVNPHEAGFLADDVTSGDGVHLTGTDAQNFANALFQKITGKGVGMAVGGPAQRTPGVTQAPPVAQAANMEQLKQKARVKARRCLRSNILAIGAGLRNYGQMEDQVLILQQALVDKKAIKNPKTFKVDGKFGPETLEAVINFQVLNKLDPDGCAGPQTLAALGVTSDTAAPKKAKKSPAGGVKVTQDTVTVGGKNYKAIGSGEDSSTKHIYVGRTPRPSSANRFLNFVSDRGSYGMNEQQGEDPSNLSMIDLINFVAKKMNIPPEVLLAVSWTETGGSPKKVFSMSFDGSYGLTQVCRPVPERKWDSFWRGHLTIYRRQFMRNPEKYGGFKPEYKYLDDKSYNQRRKVLYKVPGGGTVKGEAIEKEYTRRRHPRSKIKPFRGCPDTFGGYWRRLETGKGVPQLDKEFMDKYMTKQRGDEVKTKQDKIKFMITDLMIGAAEMRRQLSRYKGDLRKAFPAYNAGSFRQNKQFKGLSSKTGAPIAFNENYQNKILTAYAWLREKAGKQVELVDVEGFDGDFKA